MSRILRIINERSSQIVALGGALINVAFTFGVPLTQGQILSLDGLLFAVIAVVIGRNITTARKATPPTE